MVRVINRRGCFFYASVAGFGPRVLADRAHRSINGSLVGGVFFSFFFPAVGRASGRLAKIAGPHRSSHPWRATRRQTVVASLVVVVVVVAVSGSGGGGSFCGGGFVLPRVRIYARSDLVCVDVSRGLGVIWAPLWRMLLLLLSARTPNRLSRLGKAGTCNSPRVCLFLVSSVCGLRCRRADRWPPFQDGVIVRGFAILLYRHGYEYTVSCFRQARKAFFTLLDVCTAWSSQQKASRLVVTPSRGRRNSDLLPLLLLLLPSSLF